MSRLSEEEIQAIMEKYKDAPMVNPDKIYPPLPPVQNVAPLVRIPELMSFTEKIGGTEYTVNAHFRKDGRDLLATLTDIFRHGTTKETLRKSLGYEISQSTFNRILNCDGVYQTLDANFVAAYAKYFNVTADYLLGIRKTSIVNEDVATMEKSTGLSESAINVLRTEMNIGHKRMIEALNLLICDMYYQEEGRRYRPFVELFANYLNFQDDNKMYALNQRENMKEAQPHTIDNGIIFWDRKNL
jgi:hypothetical protein